MAALTRPTEATYAVHEKVTVDTHDRQDHTFCGVMFPVKCKDVLPVHHIVINSVSVRGELGPMTVWINKVDVPSTRDKGKVFSIKKRDWTKVYERAHGASCSTYCELKFDEPIVMYPGQTRAFYIHSTRPGDEAIVYDNKHQHKTHDDNFISIFPGRAHVSETVFGTVPMWGWGNAWRNNREFVGRFSYGVVYRLWNPSEHLRFGPIFHSLVLTLLGLQRRVSSPMSLLPDDCIYYIVNMCRWDWVNDSPDSLKEIRQRQLQQQAEQQQASGVASADQTDQDDDDVSMDDDDEEYEEEEEEEDEDHDVDSDDETFRDDYNEEANYFHYYDDSDEEETQAISRQQEEQRRLWIRQHFTRIHVLNRLANSVRTVGVDIDYDDDDFDDDE